MMMKPRIGLAMDVEDGSGPRATKEKSPFVFLKSAYVERVIEAGGVPLLLPPTHDEEAIDAYLDSVDGLIVTGSGIDIPGEMYGHERHPKTGRLLPAKSEFEVRLIRRAGARALPYLGICNGMQVMNVAYGGTLYQDLQSEKGVKHDAEDATQPCHGVTVEKGTKLHLMIGAPRADVNSSHHQAVRDLGKGLVVAAISESDGIVEAVEDPSLNFAIGVQWHPELIPAHAGSRTLFAELIRAAARPRLKAAARDA